jgi:hypothetical protein
MRKILILGFVLTVAGVALVAGLWMPDPTPPAVGPTDPECARAAAEREPDLVFSSQQGRSGIVRNVSFGELPAQQGKMVRVLGFLHVEFENVALYGSRQQAVRYWEGHDSVAAPGVWPHIGRLWPYEAYWRTRGPSISGRCARITGTYRPGPAGHFGMFAGEIVDVQRLEVWSQPHRPWHLPELPAPTLPKDDER